MTYAQLRRDISQWTSNTTPEFLESINGFIKQAEARIGMAVKLPAYNATGMITATATQSTTALTIPGFIEVNHIFSPQYGIVEKKDTSFILEAYPDNATEFGNVRFFAMVDDKTIMWGPTPATTQTLTMEFSSKWPSLVDLGETTPTQETFISSRFEPALLHGCLYYANLWMKDSDSAQMHYKEMGESMVNLDSFNTKNQKQKSEKGNGAIVNG